MSLAPVLRLLEERTGMQAGALGEHAVGLAVRGRMAERGTADPRRYAQVARDEPGELQALIDAVVVPETWFYRGGSLFDHLAGVAMAALRERPAGAMFRSLSVPCSTGEEPLSLAIALAEVGAPADRCPIDGVDICARAIERARRGAYTGLSFRQISPPLRDRYFQPAGVGWQVVPELQERVNYRVGNLLDLGALNLMPGYDLIFCRNVLIYFNAAARRVAVQSVVRLLAAGGLLCLGHADPIDPVGAGLERVGPEAYFLLRKGGRRGEASVGAKRKPEGRLAAEGQEARPAVASPQTGAGGLLTRARACADAGRLDEAIRLCREAEAGGGPTAEGCALEGVVHQAAERRDEARRCFQKALYLQPDHREAIFYLMLMHQEAGELEKAAAYRRRLEQIGASGPGGER